MSGHPRISVDAPIAGLASSKGSTGSEKQARREGGWSGRRHIATEDLFQGEMEGGRGGQRSDKDYQDQKLVTDHSSATPNW